MGRSYLFTGRDTEHLSPAERQLEALYDQLDRPGYRLSPTQFYQLPQVAQLMDQLYGGLEDRIPPGSQIVSQTPGKLTYRDAEGYEHNVIRKPDGQFTESTNRPSILPNQRQDDLLAQLQQRIEQAYNQPPQLAALPPEVQAQLDAISSSEQASLNRQAADERGRLVAQLYGNRVNQSSIADDQSARFIEALGRLQGEQRANAASRTLGVQQYLTGLGQQQNEGIANLLATLSGQGTQRDIAGAGLDLDRARLNESSRQFNASNYLDQLRAQLQQEELDASRSPLNKALGIIGAIRGGSAAIGGGLSAYDALRKRF